VEGTDRLDLVGFPWIQPSSHKRVHTSRHPRPARQEPTSHEKKSDLVGLA